MHFQKNVYRGKCKGQIKEIFFKNNNSTYCNVSSHIFVKLQPLSTFICFYAVVFCFLICKTNKIILNIFDFLTHSGQNVETKKKYPYRFVFCQSRLQDGQCVSSSLNSPGLLEFQFPYGPMNHYSGIQILPHPAHLKIQTS